MVRAGPPVNWKHRCLGSVGAGPLESNWGTTWGKILDRVEHERPPTPKFHQALCGVWRFMMTDGTVGAGSGDPGHETEARPRWHT